MSYPLPGETVVESRRNVEFGYGHYSRDEPAPDDVAVVFRSTRKAEGRMDRAWDRWFVVGDRELYGAYLKCLDEWERAYNQLLRVMRKHKYKTFVSDGCRLRYVAEPEGCRRAYVDVEEVTK